MTPREELITRLDLDNRNTSTDVIVKQFAIGHWVKVSERLPEFGPNTLEWTGYIRDKHDRQRMLLC